MIWMWEGSTACREIFFNRLVFLRRRIWWKQAWIIYCYLLGSLHLVVIDTNSLADPHSLCKVSLTVSIITCFQILCLNILHVLTWSSFIGLFEFIGCLQCERPGFDSWIGKIPWKRQWQSTPVLLPGKSHGWRSLVGYSPWARKESDTTERLHFHLALHCYMLAFSSCSKRGLLSNVVCRLLVTGTSYVVEQELHGVWASVVVAHRL